MKKIYIVLIVIVILILILALSLGAYYIITEKGKEYEIAKVEEYNYFVLKKNDSYGVMDKKGDTVINPEYDDVVIPNPEKAVFVCYKGDNTEVFNEKKEQILSEYEGIEPIRFKNVTTDLMYEKTVLRYKKDNKYGIIDFQGKKLTDAIYDEIDSLQYKEGELLVKKDEKYGIINIKGNKIIDVKYDEISVDGYYTEEDSYKYSGYIVGIKTEEGYRYGYINHKGKEILDTEFNEITRVTEIDDNENLYLICAKNGQYGLNKNNQTVIQNEYQSIEYDRVNKVFIVEKSKKYGVANIEGQIILPIEYNQIDITGIYLYAKNEQGTSVYDTNGKEVNIDSNIAVLNTDNENYKIRINNEQGTKYGVINNEGKQLIEEKYNYIKYLYDNYFIASYENGKLGIIDDKENIKIELNNDSLQQLKDAEIIETTISENKMIRLYSNKFEMICEMQKASVDVQDGYIKIYNDTETKYFDKKGNEINNIDAYPNNKIFVKSDGNQYGFVDKQGNIVVDYKYDKAYELNEYGFAAVKKDEKWGVINAEGQEIVAPVYTFKENAEPYFIGAYYRVIYGLGEFYFTDNK